jgi:DNA-binding NtrC family response regulator
MPDSLREVWTGPRGELSQIEFRSRVVVPRDDLLEASETWLAGESVLIERLRARATELGRDGAAVAVVVGEAGSGKLRVAQWIHRCGQRASRSLLVLDGDDPSVSEQLDRIVASLLQPNGAPPPGTLVVRNCEKADEQAHARMLDVLAHQGVELVCALILLSKKAPESLASASPVLAQLLGRAGPATLSVPALRHRRADVPELARQFTHEAATRYDKTLRGVSPQALAKLEAHEFPGNVRELRAMVEQAVLRSSGDWVTGESFSGFGGDPSIEAKAESELVIRLPGSTLREIEVAALRLALELSEGRIVRAAELLGITRHALRRKLEKFNLNDLRAV